MLFMLDSNLLDVRSLVTVLPGAAWDLLKYALQTLIPGPVETLVGPPCRGLVGTTLLILGLSQLAFSCRRSRLLKTRARAAHVRSPLFRAGRGRRRWAGGGPDQRVPWDRRNRERGRRARFVRCQFEIVEQRERERAERVKGVESFRARLGEN